MTWLKCLTAAWALSFATAFGQNAGVTLNVGQAPPPLRLQRLLQAPVDSVPTWDALKGQVVVLEFWATWCAPCVSAIPHLNQLAEEFARQPVIFLSVANDEEERLVRFLKDRPMKGWIGLDATRANWPAFDVASIPHTVVIGPDGRVIGITLPEQVTSEVLRKVLAGESIELPVKETRQSNLDWDQEEVDWRDGVQPLFEIIIKPIRTATAGSWLRPERNHLTADGISLRALVSLAYDTDSFHLDWRLPDSEQGYRVAVTVPKGREDELRPLFQQSLASTFGFQTHWETQEKEVYVLRVPAGVMPGLTASTTVAEEPTFEMLRGTIKAKAQPLARLSDALTSVLDLPVVDETGLAGRYDWELPYQPGQLTVILGAVKDKLGLDLVKTQRSIRMLIVEPTPMGLKH